MKINIHIDLKKPQEKYFYISYDLELTEDEKSNLNGELILNFPAWTPGSYLMREHERLISGFAAETHNGKTLKFKKINKCQWQIKISDHKKIRVRHRIYANLLNVRGVFTDNELILANTCGLLFHPNGFLQNPVKVHFHIEKSWQLFLAKRPTKNVYHFNHYDELYDTPFFAAKDFHLDEFKVKKTKFRIVYWGYSSIDLKKVVPELKKIIAKQIEIFGDHPCEEYLFQVVLGNNLYGGLEHSHCSTNMFDGSLLHKESKFKDFLSLLAHEHFHLWNVKRIRPRALGPFDYLKEVYTRELWIAEGVTRFYDEHSLLRSGLHKPKEYLEIMAESMTTVHQQKAYKANSLSESSFDAWIRFYRRDENHENTVANYYLKGSLVLLILDLQIIKVTEGKYSLDNVMRDLYKLYKKRPELGITREEFFEVVKKYSKRDGKRFIAKYIDGTAPFSWAETLAPFGIEVGEKKVKDPYYLGAAFKASGRNISIQKIQEDSPAFYSDLQVKDEILAINWRRVDSLEVLDHLLDEPKAKFIYNRNGHVAETTVELVKNTKRKTKLKISENLTKSQKALLEAFLRTPYE